MALSATMYHVVVGLSDVDRGVYETLDLRLAQHPSESLRYLLTRTLAYCLSYEEGIAFSKGGLSSAEDPPIAVHDPTGILLAWIDVGAPSAERLHKASKAARRVAVWSSTDLALLQREAATRAIHTLETIELTLLDPNFLDQLASKLKRNLELDMVRTENQLYVTASDATFETTLTSATFA